MSYPSKREFFVAFFLFIIVAALIFGSRYSRLYNSEALTVQNDVEILIHERTNLEQFTRQLDSLEVMFDEEELLWAGRILGWRNFRPGRYLLEEKESYESLFSRMARGIQDPVNLIVHSGIDIDSFSFRLSQQLKADSTAFASQFSDSSELALELDLTGEELFARMLPNTYQIFWTTQPEDVIRRIHKEFSRTIVDKYADDIADSPLSLEEILILASVVDWEANNNEEKPRISGLYLNRLNRGMRLQADPTVIYALGEKRRLLYEDYSYDHPYNTYRYRGLPPGPITNPDEASIRSVLFPEEHDYLFMVATPDGGHEFNRTFEEHRRSSENWRRWIREQYRIKEERENQERNSSS